MDASYPSTYFPSGFSSASTLFLSHPSSLSSQYSQQSKLSSEASSSFSVSNSATQPVSSAFPTLVPSSLPSIKPPSIETDAVKIKHLLLQPILSDGTLAIQFSSVPMFPAGINLLNLTYDTTHNSRSGNYNTWDSSKEDVMNRIRVGTGDPEARTHFAVAKAPLLPFPEAPPAELTIFSRRIQESQTTNSSTTQDSQERTNAEEAEIDRKRSRTNTQESDPQDCEATGSKKSNSRLQMSPKSSFLSSQSPVPIASISSSANPSAVQRVDTTSAFGIPVECMILTGIGLPATSVFASPRSGDPLSSARTTSLISPLEGASPAEKPDLDMLSQLSAVAASATPINERMMLKLMDTLVGINGEPLYELVDHVTTSGTSVKYPKLRVHVYYVLRAIVAAAKGNPHGYVVFHFSTPSENFNSFLPMDHHSYQAYCTSIDEAYRSLIEAVPTAFPISSNPVASSSINNNSMKVVITNEVSSSRNAQHCRAIVQSIFHESTEPVRPSNPSFQMDKKPSSPAYPTKQLSFPLQHFPPQFPANIPMLSPFSPLQSHFHTPIAPISMGQGFYNVQALPGQSMVPHGATFLSFPSA